MSLPKNWRIFRDITEGLVCTYKQWQIMKIQQVCCYVALNIDQLLYAFVDYSADIEVVITELLEFMAVCGKVNHSLPFLPKFKHEKRPKR